MKGNKRIVFLDCLMVFLNLAGARGNILLFWILGTTNLIFVLTFVVCVDLLYLFLRFKGLNFIKNIGFSVKLAPLYFIFSLLAVNYFNALREGAGLLGSTVFVLLVVLFGFILGGLCKVYTRTFNHNGTIVLVNRGYVWISLLTLLGIFISFALDLVLGVHKVPIKADFLEANMEMGTTYYRSFFSVLINDTDMRIPFFQSFGIFTGFFHEPQVSTHIVFPCLILLIGFLKNKRQKVILVLSSLFFMLFSASTTNIMVVGICIIVYFFVKSKTNFFVAFLGILASAMVVMTVLYLDRSNTLRDFVLDRLNPENRSQLYSISMLAWTFSPRTLLGNNFLQTEYVFDILNFERSQTDVGYIPFILLVGFIITYFINTIKLIRIDNKYAKAVGFASLYFILHSSKIGMPMFILTLPVLLIYLQYLSLDFYGRSSSFK